MDFVIAVAGAEILMKKIAITNKIVCFKSA